MADLPFLNPKLRVESVGFRPWQGQWLGALVTPWSLNLVLLPGEGQWETLAMGGERFAALPAGRYRFIAGHDEELGEYHACSLFSPVARVRRPRVGPRDGGSGRSLALFDAAKRRAPTATSLPGGRAAGPPAAVSKRDFLRGRFLRHERWRSRVSWWCASPRRRGQVTRCRGPRRAPARGGKVVFAGGRPAEALAARRARSSRSAAGRRPSPPPRPSRRRAAGREAKDCGRHATCASPPRRSRSTRGDSSSTGRGSPGGRRRSRRSRAGARCWRRCSRRRGRRCGSRGARRGDRVGARGDLRLLARRIPRHRYARRRSALGGGHGRTSVAALAAELLAARPPLGASDVAFLPYGDDRWVARALAPAIDGDADFDDVPHWQGAARETGALARMAGHPLVADAIARLGRGVGARLVARLVDMAAALETCGGRHGAVAARAKPRPSPGWRRRAGCSCIACTLEGERHRQLPHRRAHGMELPSRRAPSRAGRSRWPADDAARLESDVRWLVASLDPCVGVRYEAGHA